MDAGGVRGMWLIPEGCADNRVILCMHGGGYVAGSIFTHRKDVRSSREGDGMPWARVRLCLRAPGTLPHPARTGRDRVSMAAASGCRAGAPRAGRRLLRRRADVRGAAARPRRGSAAAGGGDVDLRLDRPGGGRRQLRGQPRQGSVLQPRDHHVPGRPGARRGRRPARPAGEPALRQARRPATDVPAGGRRRDAARRQPRIRRAGQGCRRRGAPRDLRGHAPQLPDDGRTRAGSGRGDRELAAWARPRLGLPESPRQLETRSA